MNGMWLHKTTLPLFMIWGFSWSSLPLFLKICLAIALTAMFGIVLVVLSIYLRRKVLQKEELQTALLSVQITDLLVASVVLTPANPSNSINKIDFDTRPFFKVGLSAKKVKQVLVQEMLNYRNYFSGRIAEQIRKLYLGLSLHKEAFARLAQSHWETRVNALSELFKMDVEVPHEQLRELVQDKNRYIREFARLSLIKFSKNDPLQVLYAIDEPISQWEELEIYLLLQQRSDLDHTSLQGLISTAIDPSIASLALKLAIYYKQQSAIPQIIALIQTPDLKLRAEAVAALGKLEAKTAENYLFTIYPEQPRDIKLAIITAMGLIGSGNYLDFLADEFLSSEDFEIKKYASDAIIRLYPISKNTIDTLMKDTETLNRSILNHSLDPLINAS
jgi:hypothetical protein